MKVSQIKSLNGIKIIALFFILAWHLNWFKQPDLGARMVEIFFACSGVCVGYLYYDRNISDKFSDAFFFTLNKIKKFYLLHFITFILSAGILYYKLYNAGDLKMMVQNLYVAIPNLLLIQSLFGKIKFSYNGVSWFLSSLIFCYFFSYIFLYYMKKISSRKVFIVLLFLFVLRYVVEFYIKKYSSIFCVDLYCHPVIRFMEYGIALCLGVILSRSKNDLSKNAYIFSGLEIFSVIIYIYLLLYILINKSAGAFLFCLQAL